MGLFGGTRRRKKSVTAQINRELKLIEKKKQKAKLASLRKQRRGF
jgi:hypothetical protein